MNSSLSRLIAALLVLAATACSEEKASSSNSPAGSAKLVTSQPKAQQYKQWHDICLTGKSKQIDAQIKKFETQLAEDPNDQLAKVYLGSACALRSKATFWGPSKLKFLKRGQTLMDQAVAQAPKNPRVRMVRAIGCYKVPKKFKRRPMAVADFNILVPIARKPAKAAGSDLLDNERQAILYYAYLTYSEEGVEGANAVKQYCHQINPDSEYGKRTR